MTCQAPFGISWKVNQLFQTHDGGIDFVPEPAKPPKTSPTTQPILPTGPADPSVATLSVLDSIKRGLEAPANGQAGWGSDVRAKSRAVTSSNTAFPLSVGVPQSETEQAPAQRIARSLMALSKRLRLSDAEIAQLAKLAGIVELDMTCSIEIDDAGWSTITYSHQLLNLTQRPIKRLTRELWFETTTDP